MAKKLLTVVGGTGTQGQSLVNAALKDGTYTIRALTRNAKSDKAEKLRARGVEVVQADVGDEQSLVAAFKDSAAVFAVTDFWETFAKHGPEKAVEVETAQGINVAKAAAKTTSLEHFIWSTLPDSDKISGGKHHVPHFAGKVRVDEYIKKDKALHAKTTFLWITYYGNNFQYPMATPVSIKTSDSYIQLNPNAAETPIWSIGSPLQNIGHFSLAILKQPHKTLPGKFVCAYVEKTTNGQMLQDWAQLLGKKAVYVQTSLDNYNKIWPAWGLEMGIMMNFWEDVGERAWTGEEGILTKDDLGLRDADFVGFKGAIKEMDWNALL